MAEDLRFVVRSVVGKENLIEMTPNKSNNYCCGAGVSGMTSALELADQGFKVYLAGKSRGLGGLAGQLRRTLEGDDVQAFVAELVEKTTHHNNIEAITGAIIVDHAGMPGMLRTGMQVGK